MPFDPATEIQNYLVFGEFGDVNPSVCDSSTYTFRSVARMEEVFDHEIEGCFLYSRHWNPNTKGLSHAMARMEAGESAQVTASASARACTRRPAKSSAYAQSGDDTGGTSAPGRISGAAAGRADRGWSASSSGIGGVPVARA